MYTYTQRSITTYTHLQNTHIKYIDTNIHTHSCTYIQTHTHTTQTPGLNSVAHKWDNMQNERNNTQKQLSKCQG